MNRRLLLVLLGLGVLACSDDPEQPTDSLEPGRMRIRLTGAVQQEAEWAGFGEFDDVLAADTGEFSFLGGRNLGMNSSDSSLVVVMRGRLQAGHWSIDEFAISGPGSSPVAVLTLDGPGLDDETHWASMAGGTMEITEAAYPRSPGLEPGLLRGRLSFRAIQLVLGLDGVPTETGDTINVSAEFAANWYHYLFPNIALSLDGGPIPGASQFAIAQSTADGHGGMLVWWDADMDGAGGQGFPFEVSHEFRMAAPGVGAFSVSSLTPPQWENPSQWPAVYSTISYRGRNDLLGLSAGGMLTITKYVPPTNAYFGEIHGTLATDLPLWTDEVSTPSRNGTRERELRGSALAVGWDTRGPAIPPDTPVVPGAKEQRLLKDPRC